MINPLDPYGYMIPEIFPVGEEPVPPIPPSPLNLVTSCDCEFWFDGRDASTFTLNGVNVAQWDDKSGNANHIWNLVDANRPSYNAATGRTTFIDANGDYLQNTTIAITQPDTIFIVCKITGGSNNWVFNGITAVQSFSIDSGNFRMYAGVVVSGHASDVNEHIHSMEFNGVASYHWLDGVVSIALNPGANNLTDFVLGANAALGNGMDGDVMEVIGYNCVITAAERNAVTAYLNAKWGVY